jgi:hypothetical protein
MLIMLMTMQIPVAGLVVNLHIAYPQCAIDLHLGIEEVGTAVTIVQSWVYHDDLSPIGGL